MASATFIQSIAQKIGKKLKRNIYPQSQRNARNEIVTFYDPVFLAIQTHGRSQGHSRYSNGYNFWDSDRVFHFGIECVHSSKMYKLLLSSLDEKVLLTTLRRMFAVGPVYIQWPLKSRRSSTGFRQIKQEFSSLVDLLKFMDANLPDSSGLVDSLSPNGNIFRLHVVLPKSKAGQVARLISIFAPIFLSFYPSQPENRRNDGLRGKLITFHNQHKLSIKCAHKRCNRKVVEAAHIKPYRSGGTDHPSNGIFLCGPHHKKQEALPYKEQVRFLRAEVVRNTILKQYLK